jgi:hypothetical protein
MIPDSSNPDHVCHDCAWNYRDRCLNRDPIDNHACKICGCCAECLRRNNPGVLK